MRESDQSGREDEGSEAREEGEFEKQTSPEESRKQFSGKQENMKDEVQRKLIDTLSFHPFLDREWRWMARSDEW